ncbi:hypothetical protein V8B97DRAFT_1861588, partial [Scleroderma yunnanense]
DQYLFYCASMLMLLKPWHSLATDLKQLLQSWDSAFNEYMSGTSVHTKCVLANIQYFHKC